jgi:spore maturation protein CgeB
MVKLLIIGSRAPGSLEGAYERSFNRLSDCQVDVFDVDSHRFTFKGFGILPRATARAASPVSRLQVQRGCDRFLSRRRDSYDAILVFKGADFSRSSLEQYRSYQRNAVWLNLNPDDPFNVSSRGSTNGNIIGAVSFFDIYLIWSRQLVPKLELNGCKRAEYLPFGYDPDLHRPPDHAASTTDHSISFIGAWDKEREATLEQLADFDLIIFGDSWRRARRKSPLASKIVARNLYGKELCEVVFRSTACLNLLRKQNNGAHNMRTFEIPAIGGLMVTTRSLEQQEYFPEGEASFMFRDADELRDQLERALADTALTGKIRSRSQALAERHSYVERATQILGLIRRA